MKSIVVDSFIPQLVMALKVTCIESKYWNVFVGIRMDTSQNMKWFETLLFLTMLDEI